MRIRVFQINPDRDPERRCFETLKPDQQADPLMYDEVYSGPVPDAGPDAIFQQFNISPPPLHRGRSMSISDIIAVDGKYLFVDQFGFKEIDFNAALVQKPTDLLKVVVVEPGQAAYIGEIGPDLKSMQRAVGGRIEVTTPLDDDVAVVSNAESKLIGMEGNCHIEGQIYAGPLFIVGDNRCGGFYSLTGQQAAQYCEDFGEPELISQEDVQGDMGMELHGF